MTLPLPIPEHQAAQPSQELTEEKSYALLSEGDARLPSHIQCSKCGEIKPRSSFKKQTTHAQAKGWGKSGRHKLEIISKNCESCRPKLRPPRKLSPRELITRATTGDLKIGAVVLEDKINKRIQDGKDGIRAGIRRKMEKKQRSVWQPMWESVSAARTRARDRLNYLKSGRATPTPDVSVILYAQAVLTATTTTAEIIKHNKRWAAPLPENTTTWTDILPYETKQHLTALFESIPHQERARMRQSSILNVRTFVENSSTTNQGEVK
jgi:ribosomal protein S26